MSKLTRELINALLPPGAIWGFQEGADLDKLYEGMAANIDTIKDQLDELAFIREPSTTTILGDLEKEFGIVQGQDTTEEDRRAVVASVKYSKGGNGDPDFLQGLLNDAGFTVFVHPNDPPVDPETILDTNEFYLAGRQGTENVDLTSEDWSMVFVVGGAATRDGITDELLSVEMAFIPSDSLQTFLRLIKRTLPMHAWGAIKVIAFEVPYFGFFEDTDPDAEGFGTTADPDIGGILARVV